MNDINTLADLLNAFVHSENERLKQKDIKHGPTIGRMYEGLTSVILNASLFKGLNLVVAKGSFIKGSHTEFDVILAEGNGVRNDYTDSYEFTPEQVLAVIQVKKSLYSKDIKDSYENLQDATALFYDTKAEEYMFCQASDAIRHTLNKPASTYSRGALNIYEEYVYHSLVTEAQMPIRIVLAYNGFKSEKNFREALVEYLSTMQSTTSNRVEGYGPNNIPNLIICDNFSCVKCCGQPFNSPLDPAADGWWHFVGTSHYNPMYFFLEMLWSKLSYKYNLPNDIFGEDLQTPALSPFLSCRTHIEDGKAIGWDYEYFDRDDGFLSDNNEIQEWNPVELDIAQFTIISELCRKSNIDTRDDNDLEDFVMKNGYKDLQSFIDGLTKTKLASFIEGRLTLLTKQCQCLIHNGKYYAADNDTGRLNNWLNKNL